MGIALNGDTGFYINIGTEKSPVWESLGKAFHTISQKLSEKVETVRLLDGTTKSEVVGYEYTVELEGEHIVGDAAQDYLLGKSVRFGTGKSRKIPVMAYLPDGGLLTGNGVVLACDIVGGKATEPSAVKLKIAVEGTPRIV